MSKEKFKALVHFMVHECKDDPDRLGAIRLNKALWYTDVAAFKANGTSVSGESYVKRQRGPVPARVLAALRELKDEGKIQIEEPKHHYDARKFISMQEPSSNLLSEDERGLAQHVLECVCGVTANEISEISHDIVWEAAELGEEIPLYATLAANEGAITEEMRAWAQDQLETERVG